MNFLSILERIFIVFIANWRSPADTWRTSFTLPKLPRPIVSLPFFRETTTSARELNGCRLPLGILLLIIETRNRLV